MKPVCFIGARGGSKGVPNKNLRLLAGKPLISYAITAALESNLFESVIVSTEDVKIAKVSRKYGADVPFIRPRKLATDRASMNDVMIHGIRKLRSLGYKFDILVNRDCTVPFLRSLDIDNSIKLLRKGNCDVVLGVYRQHHNPYFNMMELDPKGFLKMSKKLSEQPMTRQNSPIVYQVNGLYTLFADKLLKHKQVLSIPRILPYEISPETGLMIDTEFEFQIADFIARKKIKI